MKDPHKADEIFRGDKDFDKKMKELEERFAGTSGDSESETILSATKQELKEGYCVMFSTNKDITRMIKRNVGSILSVMDYGYAAQFKIDKKALRGFSYAFKTETGE